LTAQKRWRLHVQITTSGVATNIHDDPNPVARGNSQHGEGRSERLRRVLSLLSEVSVSEALLFVFFFEIRLGFLANQLDCQAEKMYANDPTVRGKMYGNGRMVQVLVHDNM
jgi:hypothetical protein